MNPSIHHTFAQCTMRSLITPRGDPSCPTPKSMMTTKGAASASVEMGPMGWRSIPKNLGNLSNRYSSGSIETPNNPWPIDVHLHKHGELIGSNDSNPSLDGELKTIQRRQADQASKEIVWKPFIIFVDLIWLHL